MSSSLIVVGVDVGGLRKGFHAVSLQNGAYLDLFRSCDAAEIAAWCRRIKARVIGVDAPCRWSADGRARLAERQLMKDKRWCFSTPRRDVAVSHPTNYYGWMLQGEALFNNLTPTHNLFDGATPQRMQEVCFETFPQVVACALNGTTVSAKDKRSIRRALLRRAGVDTCKLTSIDAIDAALCALAAHYLALGTFKAYGDAISGFIVLPSECLRPTLPCR